MEILCTSDGFLNPIVLLLKNYTSPQETGLQGGDVASMQNFYMIAREMCLQTITPDRMNLRTDHLYM